MTTTNDSPVVVASRIVSATVFRQGALVRRTARLDFAAGAVPRRVRIAGLPLMIDDGSLRVTLTRADGSRELGLIASDAHVALEPSDGYEPPANIETELREARRAEAHLQSEMEEISARLTVLGQLKLANRAKGEKDGPPGPIPSAARLAFIDWQESQIASQQRRLAELERELDDARRGREALEARRDRLGDDRPAERHELRKSVLVDLQLIGAATMGAVELHLDYLAPGASWAATYRVEFDRALNRAHLAFRALIRQQTGEDWSQVAVTFSTAAPHAWRELPELASRRIGRRQARPASGWRAPPLGASTLFEDFDRELRRPGLLQFASKPTPARRGRAVLTDTGELIVDGVNTGVARGGSASASFGAPSDAEKRRSVKSAASPVPPSPPAQAPPARSMRSYADITKGGSARSIAPMLPVAAPQAAAPGGWAIPEPAPQALPSTLFDYGRLSLPAFSETRRGELVFSSRLEWSLQLSLALGWRVSEATYRESYNAQSRRVQESEVSCWTNGGQTWNDPEGYDYAYPTESLIDAPSDGRALNVPVLARSCSARARYVSVPRESPQVFRVAEFDNPLDSPLPPGPVDVVVGGEYLLTSRLPAVATRSTARLGLGVEQGVKVARNTHYREEAANFLGGSLDLIHEIAVEIANRLDHAARVEIRERVPTKTEGDEQIAVTVAPADPPWKPFQPEDGSSLEGGYCWTIDVAPHAAVKLKGGYTVRIAAKNEVVGGNRREG